jgi:ribosome biogenesis protein MAK21
VSTILKSGTVSDKVSALTILIQESPLFHFKQLNDVLFEGMALKKARREALMAVDSIKDLLLKSILPDRKLKYFADQPFSAAKCSSTHAILWYFEDLIKKFFYKFIQLLEVSFSY